VRRVAQVIQIGSFGRSTGLPCGVRRYASGQASFLAISGAASDRRFASTRREPAMVVARAVIWLAARSAILQFVGERRGPLLSTEMSVP
jgi:hypothetical protein